MFEEKIKLGIIVQARISSTRLPKKIILPIEGNESFLDILLKKLKSNFSNIPVILATSVEKSNDILERVSKNNGIMFFRGSENNVLDRFIECSRAYKLNTVIRICSDNPFLDIGLLKALISSYKGEDYLSYKVNGVPSILTHYGFFAEIVKVEALEKVTTYNNPDCIEHVTNCIYKNKNIFDVNFIEKLIEEKHIRCTLDTNNDFLNLKTIYNDYYRHNLTANYNDIINFISTKKELQYKMKEQILNNIK